MKVAIIGLGNISGRHIMQWQKIPVKVVAGSDINPEAVAKAQEQGLQGYADWRQMLDDVQPDIVSICTPPFLHREMSVECLNRGIHVLCEKPMAATLEDAEVMAEAAAHARARLMIAYCHRFHGPMLKMKELIDGGILGKVVFFRGTFTGLVDFSANHRSSLKMAGGGSLMDNGSHAADLYQFLLGKFSRVSCRVGTFMQDMETDDVGIILFTGENGCFGEIIAGYSLPHEFNEWTITGDKGVLTLPNYDAGPVYFRPHDSQAPREFPCDTALNRFDRMFAHFLECVEQDREPLSNAQTALHIQRVIARAYEAARDPGVVV